MLTPTGPHGSTRQQLDELDALLQRMLELPLSQLEPTPAAPPPVAPLAMPAAQPAAMPAPAYRPPIAAYQPPQPMPQPVAYQPPAPAPYQPPPPAVAPTPMQLFAPAPQPAPPPAPLPMPAFAPQPAPAPAFAYQPPPPPYQPPQPAPMPMPVPQPMPQPVAYQPPQPAAAPQPPAPASQQPMPLPVPQPGRPMPQPTALDSSWHVELPPGARPPAAAPQSVFAAWTAEHALPGSVQFGQPRERRGPVRLQESHDDLPGESQITRLDSPLGDARPYTAPPRPAPPQATPQPQYQPPAAPQELPPLPPLPAPRGASHPLTPEVPAPHPVPDLSAVTDTPPPHGDVPLLLWPLAAGNWVLETGLCLFGPPGRALASPGGKSLLGWTGVLLILGAVGVGAADWFGFDWAG